MERFLNEIDSKKEIGYGQICFVNHNMIGNKET